MTEDYCNATPIAYKKPALDALIEDYNENPHDGETYRKLLGMLKFCEIKGMSEISGRIKGVLMWEAH